ncbi:hypothetical protein, partial [Moorena sp. SIO3H5]|uniref:hypothetical protein n=1 Tax=Moorena sp. SIO3H5 TaxID=2607834 RepID=UPI0025F2DC9B
SRFLEIKFFDHPLSFADQVHLIFVNKEGKCGKCGARAGEMWQFLREFFPNCKSDAEVRPVANLITGQTHHYGLGEAARSWRGSPDLRGFPLGSTAVPRDKQRCGRRFRTQIHWP